jgi:hypothetical protein
LHERLDVGRLVELQQRNGAVVEKGCDARVQIGRDADRPPETTAVEPIRRVIVGRIAAPVDR